MKIRQYELDIGKAKVNEDGSLEWHVAEDGWYVLDVQVGKFKLGLVIAKPDEKEEDEEDYADAIAGDYIDEDYYLPDEVGFLPSYCRKRTCQQPTS